MQRGKPFFSGNYGSALGSTANAANLIARAGEAQGQMFANLGNIAAETLDKFREKKEEKQKEDQFEALGKKLPIETFAPFGVKTEDERDELLKIFKKKGNREGATMLATLGQQGQAREGKRQFQNLMMGTAPQKVAPSDSSIRDFFAQEKMNEQAQGLGGQANPEMFRQGVAKAAQQGQLNPQGQELAMNRFMALQQAKQASDLAESKFQRELAMQGPQLTEGQKSLDQAFAKDIMQFNEPDVRKGLAQLTEASTALGESDDLTGPFVGLMPKVFKDIANPKASEVQEAVEEVVQRNLRLVLGAQFTEKEGERLISRAYNPRLKEAENKKRVDRLITSIESAMNEKIAQRAYFQQNGTLTGYNYQPISITSIEQNAFGGSESPSVTTDMVDSMRKKIEAKRKALGL
jgi:hypothetical protein